MKKAILTSVVALATLSAAANTFDYGYSSPRTVGGSGSYSQRPVALDDAYSGCQTLYTYEELHDMYKVGSDGSVTKAAITEVSFLLTGGTENYFSGASFDVTVYVENTDATTFPLNDNGKPVFFDFSKAVTGKVTVNGDYSDEWNDFLEWGGYETYESGLPVTITLDTPIEYDGAGLLFTWICETDGTEDLFFNGECYGLDPKNGVKTLFVHKKSAMSELSGEGDAGTYLPALKLAYDEVTVGPSAPEIVYGEPADFEVGKFSAPSVERGSTGEFMPFDGAYKYSGTQALYTSVELSGLNKIADGEITKAEIQDVTFLVSAEDGMYFYNGETVETTVYVQNTTATEFEKDEDGKIKWFEYSDLIKGTATIDFFDEEWADFLYGMGGLYPVKIHLDTPIMYEGNSLLFTWETESDCNDETWVNATAAVATAGVQAVNMSSDKETFAQSYASGYPKNSRSYVPVLKLHYVPVTEKGGSSVNVVTFDNVDMRLVESTGSVGSYSKANSLCVSFELNDPADCEEYEIKLGTTSLGTINSKSATISFMGIPAGDVITLNVVPAGENTIGVPYEIAKSDIEALFPAPEMELVDTSFADFSYELVSMPESVKTQGAAQFFFTNYKDAPVSEFNWLDLMNPGDKNVIIHRSGSGAIGDLITDYPYDYKNVQLNKGKIALAKPDAVQATTDASTGKVKSYSGSLYIQFAVDYPLYYSAVPSLTEGASANTTPSKDVKATVIQRKYDNGSTYASNQLRADFNSITHPGEVECVHPETLVWEWFTPGKTIRVVGAKGTTLHYKKIENEDAAALASEDGFARHDNELPYMLVDIAQYDGSGLHIQARKDNGDVHSELKLFVKDDNITGVSDVAKDQPATVEYFNLQGVRVEGDLTPGVYVRRQGATTSKVIVK